MKSIQYIITALMMMGLVTGCVSQDYTDTKKEAESVQSRIEQLTPVPELNNVSAITRPPVVVTPLVKKTNIPWLTQTTKVHVTRLPLSQVLSEVMRGVPADIWFDNDVNAMQTVSLSANTSRQNVLNLLSSQTGYGFVPSANKVEVRRYLAETFTLTIPVGNVSAQQGSKGGSADPKSTKVEGQFISTTLSNADMIAEVTNAIKAVLKSNEDSDELIGGVEAVPTLSSFIVRTTPDRMRQVRQIVAQYKKELKKQVVLNIQILEFRSNLGKDRGIDWNILKDIGEGSLQFVIPGTTTAAASNGFGMAFQGSGKWDGTTAFIKALEQQGSVSTETPINIQTLSNQPGRISQTVVTPFIEDIKVNVTENTTTTETVRGEVSEGVDVFVSANIQHDHVWLRMAGTLTKIAADTTEKVGENELRMISTRNVDLNFTNNLRYGQSVVIGSIKQQTTQANKSASFGVDALGAQATNNETVETLILLTPRRVR
ncbi:type II and III secretion system protein [Shewanella colwelliana]|uniref:type II and III secretion system protein n=1 Tax=Shewanella colwelliana TaxID=23 RepID=UPI003736C1D9